MYPLSRLQVYAQAVELARVCYAQSRRIADRDLQSQLVRATRSIPANLAEGAGSGSQAAFARYIAIAAASTREVRCHLEIARDATLLDDDAYHELLERIDNLAPRLYKLLDAVRRNDKRRTRSTP